MSNFPKSYLSSLPIFEEVVTRMADEGHTVGVSYLKFVNAFDFVIHKFLLTKMTPFGFGDIVVGGLN